MAIRPLGSEIYGAGAAHRVADCGCGWVCSGWRGVCAVGGPGPIVVGGALGALFAVAIIGSAEAGPRYPGVWFPWPAPMPPSYPARLREMRQKLVYRAP